MWWRPQLHKIHKLHVINMRKGISKNRRRRCHDNNYRTIIDKGLNHNLDQFYLIQFHLKLLILVRNPCDTKAVSDLKGYCKDRDITQTMQILSVLCRGHHWGSYSNQQQGSNSKQLWQDGYQIEVILLSVRFYISPFLFSILTTLIGGISLVKMTERSKKKLMALTTNVMRDDSDKGLGLQVVKYLAAKYEELGCEVKWMGKPDKVI
ncbi:uncharacterized protein LOC112186610 isoform X2 [Rosa chinensis]|uniref:uncharacterized protein LOC112186610 isoform X2 n=1 Tax=Rosa chinensis TaxID=74649 RepID=UPI001AD944BA|nr:uncharacterized protein LOC112186610 isoform X2 [Rosa chinensis]